MHILNDMRSHHKTTNSCVIVVRTVTLSANFKDVILVFECLVDSDGFSCILLSLLHVFNPFFSALTRLRCVA